jgi:hypothetical protein
VSTKHWENVWISVIFYLTIPATHFALSDLTDKSLDKLQPYYQPADVMRTQNIPIAVYTVPPDDAQISAQKM